MLSHRVLDQFRIEQDARRVGQYRDAHGRSVVRAQCGAEAFEEIAGGCGRDKFALPRDQSESG